MKGMRKRETERKRAAGERGGIGETGNLRSPSDCRNGEHLYVYKLSIREPICRAHFSNSLNSIVRILIRQQVDPQISREMKEIDNADAQMRDGFPTSE